MIIIRYFSNDFEVHHATYPCGSPKIFLVPPHSYRYEVELTIDPEGKLGKDELILRKTGNFDSIEPHLLNQYIVRETDRILYLHEDDSEPYRIYEMLDNKKWI